jgi:hypothetical protein
MRWPSWLVPREAQQKQTTPLDSQKIKEDIVEINTRAERFERRLRIIEMRIAAIRHAEHRSERNVSI